MADDDYVRLSPACAHDKPIFRSSGRQRAACYDCQPAKRTGMPRKKYEGQLSQCKDVDCGQAFTKQSPHQRYCSDRCRIKAANLAGQMRRRNSEPRPCRWCDKVYVPEYGSKRTYYCTVECRDAAKRKVRSGSSHIRRAIKHGAAYESINKRLVFERDGWRCYLCGRDTPKRLSGSMDDAAPELEHVVPLSRGGAHRYDNVRCACRRCNRMKGAMMPGEGGGVWISGASMPMTAWFRTERLNPPSEEFSKWPE